MSNDEPADSAIQPRGGLPRSRLIVRLSEGVLEAAESQGKDEKYASAAATWEAWNPLEPSFEVF